MKKYVYALILIFVLVVSRPSEQDHRSAVKDLITMLIGDDDTKMIADVGIYVALNHLDFTKLEVTDYFLFNVGKIQNRRITIGFLGFVIFVP